MTYLTQSHATLAASARPRRTLGALVDLWRQRQALSRLDDRALADIGVTPSEAHSEAKRPVWDVPATWRA